MSDQAEQTRDIGRYILVHVDDILKDWERVSREEHPEASDEQRQKLRNSLPEFLERFGEALAGGSNRVPRSFAIEHGIQRWEIGWDVSSLARDFMILRRVLARHLVLSVGLDMDDMLSISASLDEAVAESVSAYVANRELELNKKNESLERKNYELKRFAHMVAHEIRNPLGLITLAASSLKRRMADQPDANEQFELIAEGRKLIIEVVDNLVHYASGVGGSDQKVEPVDLGEVFQDATDHLKYLIKGTGAEVTSGELPTVLGNAVALRSVFQNLIENALKYAGDQPPRVHVSAALEPQPQAGREGDAQGSFWAIAFRDEGIGISPEDQKHIFRFLSRVNIKPEVHGTGVGLALCRRVAEQHGGTISVKSATGMGSTFTLRLPKHPVEAE